MKEREGEGGREEEWCREQGERENEGGRKWEGGGENKNDFCF